MEKNAPFAAPGTLLAILFVGLTFRFLGALEPIWLDELWAIAWVRRLAEFSSIFADYRSENNHFLQSIWLFAVRDTSSVLVMRAFSLFCSAVLLFICFQKAKQSQEAWRQYFFFFISISFVFVLYGSEARGYGPLLLFLYLVFEASEELVKDFSVKSLALFWLAVLFASSTHLSAFTFIAAVLLGFIPRLGLFRSIIAGILPVSLLALFWVFFVSRLSEASGDYASGFSVELLALNDILSTSIGGPEMEIGVLGILSLVSAFGALVWVVVLLVSRIKAGEGDSLFFLSAIVLVPLAAFILYSPKSTYPRHFLPSVLAVYLLSAQEVARLLSLSTSSSKRRGLCFIALIFLVGNLTHNVWLARYGRGDYRAVIKEIANDSGPIMTDHGFRHQSLLRYYGDQMGLKVFTVSDETNENLHPWSKLPVWSGELEEAKWFLAEGEALPDTHEVKLEDYTLYSIHSSAALSGWSIYLYKRKSDTSM